MSTQALLSGLERLLAGGIDAVLLDLGLPDSQGLETFVSVRDQAPELPIIVLTGFDDVAVANMAVRGGAQDYLVKGDVDVTYWPRITPLNRAQACRIYASRKRRPSRIRLDYILSSDKDVKNISLNDLIDLEDLQQIQDAFAAANDVASIISDINGKPITKASNFCGVCEIIRSTEKGDVNCVKSDKILGENAKARMKPIYGKCLSCGFVDASAPIIVALWYLELQ